MDNGGLLARSWDEYLRTKGTFDCEFMIVIRDFRDKYKYKLCK